MRYLTYLIVVLLGIVLLPLEASGQKRSSKSTRSTVKASVKKPSSAKASSKTKRRTNRSLSKKTAYVKKAKPKMPTVSNPLVKVMLNPNTATIVPYCTEDSTNVVINIYFKAPFVQSMKYENGKFYAFRTDITMPPIQSGGVFSQKDDPRWVENFLEPKDLQLMQTFQKELNPEEMQFYPMMAKSAISSIVLRRAKWYQEDIAIARQILVNHLGGAVSTNYVSDCLNLPRRDAVVNPL